MSLLTPFKVLAQKCEEKLDCYKKYEECMEDGKKSAEKEAELEYQRCVNSKLLTFDKYPDYSKYCDPKSYNKAKWVNS